MIETCLDFMGKVRVQNNWVQIQQVIAILQFL